MTTTLYSEEEKQQIIVGLMVRFKGGVWVEGRKLYVREILAGDREYITWSEAAAIVRKQPDREAETALGTPRRLKAMAGGRKTLRPQPKR